MTNEQRQLECRLQSLRPEFASGRRESLALAPQAFTRRCANRVVRPVRRVDTSSSASHLARCEGIMLGPVRALARRPERSPFTLSREAVAIVCRQHFQIPARQRARVSFRRRVSAELDDRVLCETVMSWFEEIRSPDEIFRERRRYFQRHQKILETKSSASLAR